MADIDLKTATPDTSLPSTGFLFGADSQSAAAPSVYSTQTVATTLLGSTSLTGATVTADSPVLNMAQTWNNAAVTFTGLKANITDTASASGSLLMDLQVGGVSKANLAKSGRFYSDVATNGSAAVSYALKTGVTTGFGGYFDSPALISGGTERLWANSGGIYGAANLKFETGINGFFSFQNDLFLTRRAAANLRLGAADAAAPVAQTLSVQSVVAGTTNTAGANLTITGSQGTGTGAGGSIVFQVAPAGSSGTAQNALATALTIDSTQLATFAKGVTAGGAITYTNLFYAGGSYAGLYTSSFLGWSSGNADGTIGSYDVRLWRDAANTLALQNGANAQAFRVYNTTDGTNSEFGKIAWSSNVLQIGTEKAGTGTARALALQTDGVTRVTVATNGGVTFENNVTLKGQYTSLGNGNTFFEAPSSGALNLFNNGFSAQVTLAIDAANTLALRNSTNAQTLRTYGTYTDASNYRRVTVTMSTAGVGEIKPEGAGTGASGNVIHISGLPTSNPGPGILWNNAGTPAIGT